MTTDNQNPEPSEALKARLVELEAGVSSQRAWTYSDGLVAGFKEAMALGVGDVPAEAGLTDVEITAAFVDDKPGTNPDADRLIADAATKKALAFAAGQPEGE